MLPLLLSLVTFMCGKGRNNLCSLLLLQQRAISLAGKLMGHHSNNRNEMLLKYHKVIKMLWVVQKGRANQEGNCLFILEKKKKLQARYFLLVYTKLGKRLISIATMLIIPHKQEVHLTYPCSLLSVGSRETLETLGSLDVR